VPSAIAMMAHPSVLVVEDTPMCAKLLCTILRQFNCSTTWVKNDQESVDLQRAEHAAYSLIIMDLGMPFMDSLAATKLIKDEFHLDTPAVALTGEGGAQIQEQRKEIDFNAYCNRPLKKE
jgi:CheY-like chemotaxis protein